MERLDVSILNQNINLWNAWREFARGVRENSLHSVGMAGFV